MEDNLTQSTNQSLEILSLNLTRCETKTKIFEASIYSRAWSKPFHSKDQEVVSCPFQHHPWVHGWGPYHCCCLLVGIWCWLRHTHPWWSEWVGPWHQSQHCGAYAGCWLQSEWHLPEKKNLFSNWSKAWNQQFVFNSTIQHTQTRPEFIFLITPL